MIDHRLFELAQVLKVARDKQPTQLNMSLSFCEYLCNLSTNILTELQE